jgi:hypothetical protein
MEKSDSHAGAVERLDAARSELGRRATQFDAASGSSKELPAATELKTAEDQCAAREAWVKWIERDY